MAMQSGKSPVKQAIKGKRDTELCTAVVEKRQILFWGV